MLPFDTILMFFSASVLLGLAPGPDNIFVLTQSALHGRKAGVLVTLGLCTGLIFHTVAVALGIAVIFKTSAVAFTVLKLVGAGYLLYLAWHAFRSGASSFESKQNGEGNVWKLYQRGIIMNITNPKVGIFFLAFLPQFSDPANGSITLQMLALGGIFIVATFVVFSAISWMAGFLGHHMQSSNRLQIVMNRVAGTVFVGLAANLIFSQR